MNRKIITLSAMCYIVIFFNIAYGGSLHHSIGLYYVSGLNDVVDVIEHNLEERGYSVDTFKWPIGLSYQPYYQFDNGLRLGAGIGPAVMTFGDVDFYDIPLKFNVGYTFFQKNSVSPYIKIGAAYHIADGDFVDGGELGFTSSIGIEFSKSNYLRWGLEVTYDSTELDFEYYGNWRRTTKAVKPAELVIGFFVVF